MIQFILTSPKWVAIAVLSAIFVVCPFDGQAFGAGLQKPYIYEIRKGGSSKVSYVFGSFHYGVSATDLPYWVQRLHRNAEVNFYEIELEGRESYRAEQDFYLNRAEAAKYLGVENSPEIRRQLREAGIPDEVASVLPMNGTCGMTAYLLTFGFQRLWETLDSVLRLESVQNGKRIVYLDTEEIRARAGALVGEDKSPPCLTKNLISDPIAAKTFFQAVEEGLLKYVKKYEAGEEPSTVETDQQADMVYRNRVWIEKLVPILSQKRSFIVVGVDHLFGREGLMNLLRQQGFQIRRLTEDPRPAEKFIRFSK